MKRQLILIALTVAVAAPSAFAVTEAQLKAIKKNLNAAPIAELPAKAAEVVSQAAKEDREQVAVTAVRAAIQKSRSSAPMVVAAVSKAAPEVAAPVSQVAAELESGQSDSIAAAAIGSAPGAKTQIISSVQKGAISSSFSSSSSSVAVNSSSSANSSGAGGQIAPTASSGPTLTARGAAHTQHGGEEHHVNTPINDNHGGDGNGRFPTSPPHSIPPGHDPDHQENHGRPSFVDYTKPRHY
jgi:hypothetical protein